MKIDDDDWVEAAFKDDTLVAEALLSLKLSSAPSFKWGQRKPRSKPAPTTAKKDREPTRFSPTTPLSWSGDATVSASDDSSAARSKGAFANESLVSASNKRSRKKTFSELKEEENLLLKERLHLERDLASARMIVREQRAASEKLKRIELDLGLKSANKMGATSAEPLAAIANQMEFSTTDDAHSTLLRHNTCSDLPSKSGFSKAPEDIGTFDRGFVLPDLNMEPSEDETISETVYGIS